MHHRLTGLVLLGTLALVACDRATVSEPAADVIGPDPVGVGVYETRQGKIVRIVDVPAVEITLPPRGGASQRSASDILDRLARVNNRAAIGIKAAAAPRAMQTGARAAIPATAAANALNAVEASGATIIKYLEHIGAVVVDLPPEAVARLLVHPNVDYIEADGTWELYGTRYVGSSSFATFDLTQTTPWGINMVNAPSAWVLEDGDAAQDLYVIDTGHDWGHEDLPDVPANDNCRGLYDGCTDSFPYPHGSHVLGIATARDNGIGVVGVAKGIAGDRVYVYGACDSATGACYWTEVATGINYGIPNLEVLNLSLGGGYSVLVANAVAQAWASDMVILAAAGNNGGQTVVYPAGYANVVGVSGVLPDSTFASTSPCFTSSNYGSHVDIAAPFYALSTARWI